MQRSVDGTTRSDLEEALLLRLIQVPFEPDLSLDAVDHPFPGVALLAVFGVDLFVSKMDRDSLQRKLLPIGVHAPCHARASAEGCEEKSIGSWPGVFASDRRGFVSSQEMGANGDGLAEPGLACLLHSYFALVRLG